MRTLNSSILFFATLTALTLTGCGGGNSGNSAATTAPAPSSVTLPTVPLGVTVIAASATQINLAWTAVTGATGYNVYRATAAGVVINSANKLNATPVATTSFSNTALTGATSYFYKVTALNSRVNQSVRLRSRQLPVRLWLPPW